MASVSQSFVFDPEDDFFDEFELFNSLTEAMRSYIFETRRNGFVPYYSQFCEQYNAHQNDDDLLLFELLLKE